MTPYDAIVDAWLASERPVAELADMLGIDPQIVAVLLAAGRRQALQRALSALAREERAWASRAGRALWAQARRAVREAIVGLSPKMALPAMAPDDEVLLAHLREAARSCDPPRAGLADDCLTALAGTDGQR